MRGKLRDRRGSVVCSGNIPAYAGKTFAKSFRLLNFSEHPRVCGENLAPIHCEQFNLGTSPRMRGKLAAAAAEGARIGNIPAYAGKTGLASM